MECPDCFKRYNRLDNMPRILIPCGHSLCQDCIQSRIMCLAETKKQDKIESHGLAFAHLGIEGANDYTPGEPVMHLCPTCSSEFLKIGNS